MNNIEIKNIKGLKAGMTSTEINKLKNKKIKVHVDLNKSERGIKKLHEDVKNVKNEIDIPYKLNLIKDEIDIRDYKITEATFNQQSTELKGYIDWTDTMSPVKDQGQLGCHDDKTEVLTNKGWKLFKDLDKTEYIATVNPYTHELEYQEPVNYFEYDYNGKMMNLIHKNKTIFSVTPNHNMYVRKWNQKERKLNENYDLIKMEDLGWYSGLLNEINSKSLLEKEERYKKVKYKLPDVEIGLRNNANNISIREGRKIELYKLIEFIGLYFAEGCCYRNKGNYRVEIAASDKNERKSEVIRIVDALGFNYTNYSDRLVIRNKSLFNLLKDFGNVYTKRVPRWIFNLDKIYIELFLNGYVLGDGRYENNGSIFCWSVNKELLDDVQELFLKIGKWSTIGVAKEEGNTTSIQNREIKSKESYYLYVWISKNMSIDKKKYIKEIDYDGKVYCVEVPNHIIITRRNNNMLVSGNSCVAFATAAMKEWQEQQEQEREIKEGKRYRRKRKYYDYSEQWIYYNCKKIDPWPDSEGTSIRCAMKVLQRLGVPCEKGWKYNDKVKGSPESWTKLISKWALIDSYYRVRGIDDLRLALENGPVVIGIYCFREIFNVGKDGMISYPSNPNEILGGHALCAVGFDDNKKLIKIKNSWSSEWGENGYGYLSYKYINDFMMDAWVAKDIQVTKQILKDNVNNELI